MGHPASNCLFIPCQRDLHISMSLRTAREVREQSGGEQRKEAKLEKKDEREKHYFDQIFKVVLSLGSSILPVCPPIEYSFLTGIHFGEFNNPLTSVCYHATQLSGLSWPHVLSEVNFVLMSMVLSSTRCSALWLNTCYPSIPMILHCLSASAALFLDTAPLTTSHA